MGLYLEFFLFKTWSQPSGSGIRRPRKGSSRRVPKRHLRRTAFPAAGEESGDSPASPSASEGWLARAPPRFTSPGGSAQGEPGGPGPGLGSGVQAKRGARPGSPTGARPPHPPPFLLPYKTLKSIFKRPCLLSTAPSTSPQAPEQPCTEGRTFAFAGCAARAPGLHSVPHPHSPPNCRPHFGLNGRGAPPFLN